MPRTYNVKVRQYIDDEQSHGSAARLLILSLENEAECFQLINPIHKTHCRKTKGYYIWERGILQVEDNPDCMKALTDWQNSILHFSVILKKVYH